MPKQEEDQPAPWRRLYHGEDQQQEQGTEAQQPQQVEEEPLTELQQQLLTCYRKTFLVAGLGLAGSIWRWNAVTKHMRKDIFVPPRAQALPAQLVENWKQKAQLREALKTVGRQTLFITGFAGLYFGVELGVGLLRDKQGDWANTAIAGAVAGGYLGARVPSSMRGRTMAMGTVVGSLMGAVSGWSQQQLALWAEAGAASSQEQPQQQLQQQRQQKDDD